MQDLSDSFLSRENSQPTRSQETGCLFPSTAIAEESNVSGPVHKRRIDVLSLSTVLLFLGLLFENVWDGCC